VPRRPKCEKPKRRTSGRSEDEGEEREGRKWRVAERRDSFNLSPTPTIRKKASLTVTERIRIYCSSEAELSKTEREGRKEGEEEVRDREKERRSNTEDFSTHH